MVWNHEILKHFRNSRSKAVFLICSFPSSLLFHEHQYSRFCPYCNIKQPVGTRLLSCVAWLQLLSHFCIRMCIKSKPALMTQLLYFIKCKINQKTSHISTTLWPTCSLNFSSSHWKKNLYWSTTDMDQTEGKLEVVAKSAPDGVQWWRTERQLFHV